METDYLDVKRIIDMLERMIGRGEPGQLRCERDLDVGGSSYEIYRLAAAGDIARLPYSLKILLENLLRTEDGANITADHIRALGGWDPTPSPTPRSSSRPPG